MNAPAPRASRLGLCTAALAAAASSAQPLFEPLGRPPAVPPDRNLTVTRIAVDGSGVLAWDDRGLDRWRAAAGWQRWTSPELIANFSHALSASGDLSVIAYRWFTNTTSGTGLVLDSGQRPFTPFVLVYDIARDGSRGVGWAYNGPPSNPSRATRWTISASGLAIDRVLWPTGPATACDADASIVVGTRAPGEAVLWTEAAGVQPLGTAPAQGITGWTPTAVSADGRTVVGTATQAAGSNVPVRWTAWGGLERLSLPPTIDRAEAVDVSDSGDLVLGWGSSDTNPGVVLLWDRRPGHRPLRAHLQQLGVAAVDAHFLRRAGALSPDGLWIAGTAEPIAGGALSPFRARIPPPCLANCDASTATPALSIADFACFLARFQADAALPQELQAQSYANCDRSTIAPVLSPADFVCFLRQFRAGC